MFTFSELERVAYIQGNSLLSDALNKAQILTEAEDELSFPFEINEKLNDQIETQIETEIKKQCPNYAEYKTFFETCFEMLNGSYPCPSVTSDYDQSVIFTAICAGEAK